MSDRLLKLASLRNWCKTVTLRRRKCGGIIMRNLCGQRCCLPGRGLRWWCRSGRRACCQALGIHVSVVFVGVVDPLWQQRAAAPRAHTQRSWSSTWVVAPAKMWRAGWQKERSFWQYSIALDSKRRSCFLSALEMPKSSSSNTLMQLVEGQFSGISTLHRAAWGSIPRTKPIRPSVFPSLRAGCGGCAAACAPPGGTANAGVAATEIVPVVAGYGRPIHTLRRGWARWDLSRPVTGGVGCLCCLDATKRWGGGRGRVWWGGSDRSWGGRGVVCDRMGAGCPANDAACDSVLCGLVLGDLRRGDVALVVWWVDSSTAGTAGKPDAAVAATAKSPVKNARAKSHAQDPHTSKHTSKIKKKIPVGPSRCRATVTGSAARVCHNTEDCRSQQKKTVRHSRWLDRLYGVRRAPRRFWDSTAEILRRCPGSPRSRWPNTTRQRLLQRPNITLSPTFKWMLAYDKSFAVFPILADPDKNNLRSAQLLIGREVVSGRMDGCRASVLHSYSCWYRPQLGRLQYKPW